MWMAREFRKLIPGVTIIVGGANATQLKITDVGVADHVVSGEGELWFVRILENLENPTEEIPHICTQSKDQKIDLDSMPPADYSDMDISLYDSRGISSEFSRGCTSNCVYCNETVFWKYRSRQADRVLDEIEIVYKQQNIQQVLFIDSLLNGNLRELRAFAEGLMERKIHISWGGYSRIDGKMDRDFWLLLKRSGATETMIVRNRIEKERERIEKETRERIEKENRDIEVEIKDAFNIEDDLIIKDKIISFGIPFWDGLKLYSENNILFENIEVDILALSNKILKSKNLSHRDITTAKKVIKILEENNIDTSNVEILSNLENTVIESLKIIYDRLDLLSKSDWDRLIQIAEKTKAADYLEISNLKHICNLIRKKDKNIGEVNIRKAHEILLKLSSKYNIKY
jgi:BMFP domain-containing protein YqiC